MIRCQYLAFFLRNWARTCLIFGQDVGLKNFSNFVNLSSLPLQNLTIKSVGLRGCCGKKEDDAAIAADDEDEDEKGSAPCRALDDDDDEEEAVLDVVA